VVIKSLFSDLYEPGLRRVVFEGYTERGTEYDKFLNVVTTDQPVLYDYEMAGFGSVPTKAEGSPIIYDDPVPGRKISYTWTAKGKGFRITHEAMVDDRYGPMKKMASSLGRAFRNKVEIDGASILNNAFGTAGGFDNEYLCDSGHPSLRGAANISNVAATDLSVTALQDALINFEKLYDHSGVPVMIRPAMLVVGPDNAPIAREILGSQFKPYTADNEINVLQEYGLTLFVSHYLTDADSWFVLANKADHDLQFFWREKFSLTSGDDFDTGDGKMKGYMRYGTGWGDWRGVWGSTGV